MVTSDKFRPDIWTYIGLFLLSTAVLHIEMVQMRIFSLSLWHHLAYLVITIALLGFGVSGTIIAIFPKFFIRNIYRILYLSCWIFALTTFAAFWITSSARLDTFKLLTPSGIQFGQLFLLFCYYAAFVIPFIAAGLAIASLFTACRVKSHSLYFVNLIGSALGVVLFAVSIGSLGGEKSIFLSCILIVGAGLFFAISAKSRLAAFFSVGSICFFAVIGIGFHSILEPIPAASKAYGMYLDTLDDFNRLYSRWNPISRIDVISSSQTMLPWLPEDTSFAPHMSITIDGDATTWMWNFGGPSKNVCDIEENLYAAAYHTKAEDHPEVMIIGLGGGNDIRTALHYDPERVVGVEINPLIVDVLKNQFPDFIDNICYAPGVTIHVAEGRSFARRSQDQFDIIQMSGVDTWSGLSSGAYVLSENYLYTVNAFEDYFSLLKPDGILAINRWYFDPPREMLRMISVGAEYLHQSGIQKPWNHILVLTSKYFCSTMFKKSPWTLKEIATYSWYAKTHEKFDLQYSPGAPPDNPFGKLMAAIQSGQTEEFYKSYVYDIRPVYDDNPFFFDYYKWSQLPGQIFSSGTGGQIGANWPIAMTILVAMLVQTCVLVLLFIFFPLTRFQHRGLHIKNAARIIGYFLCLGVGYIFIEIVFMQKLVLYLGHPIYSISVVLTGLLFFSGIGSLVGSVLPFHKRYFLSIILSIIVCLLIAERYLMPFIIEQTLSETLPIRIFLTICLLAPPAFFMGMPFPAGLIIVGKSKTEVIPWAWGANGGATVLGSIVSIILAMNLGFHFVMFTGALLYLTALILFFPRKQIFS